MKEEALLEVCQLSLEHGGSVRKRTRADLCPQPWEAGRPSAVLQTQPQGKALGILSPFEGKYKINRFG